jgi:hypothetical protein
MFVDVLKSFKKMPYWFFLQKIHWNEKFIYWNLNIMWLNTHWSYKADLNIFSLALVASPSLWIGNIWPLNSTRYSLLLAKFASLGLSSFYISQKLWSTQHITITLIPLSILELKCLKICHQFFFMNQKHFLS